MRASRRFRRMVKIRAKSDVQKIMEEIMNNVSMRRSKKKEVLTSSHLGQVVLNFCSLTIKYLIHFKFVRYFIIRISHIFHIHEIYLMETSNMRCI